jgi:hypothetical protein
VAFAIKGETPTKTKAGNVIKLPPPAIEFKIPPKNPAKKSNIMSISKESI